MLTLTVALKKQIIRELRHNAYIYVLCDVIATDVINNAYIYIQVNKKFCELKGGNIGIVEKAQETIFGMSPKYSRYIGIVS